MKKLFKIRSPIDLKHQYQEGTAEGLKLECLDGEIACEIVVPMSKCKFMRISILAKLRDPGYTPGNEIKLDYRRFEKKTMKYFVDALYDCIAEPIPMPELLKLVQLVSKMGFTETGEWKQELPCTSEILTELVECLEENIESVSLEEKIDIGFCLFNFQDEMVQKAMNKCFEGVTAGNLRGRAFCYLFDGIDSTMVHDLVKLALRDSGMDGTDDEVRAQIVERTKKIAQQMDFKSRVEQFLDSPEILRDISLEYLTGEIGGTVYVDVGAEVPRIKSMLTPPSSATHVLFGAGLKGETTLKLAVVAKKEEIFDQKNYKAGKAKKVQNFYTYATKDLEAIGFSADENVYLNTWDFYDSNKANGDHCAKADLLDDHRLSILTNSEYGNLCRCGSETLSNTSSNKAFKNKYRTVFVYF